MQILVQKNINNKNIMLHPPRLLPLTILMVAARFAFAADAADGDLPPCSSGNAASNLTCWDGSFGRKTRCAKEANACVRTVTTSLADPSRVSASGGCAYWKHLPANTTKIYPSGAYALPKLLRVEETYCYSDLCNVLPESTASISCNFKSAAPNASVLSCGLDSPKSISYNEVTHLYKLETPTCQTRRETNVTSKEWIMAGTCAVAKDCKVGDVKTADGIQYTTTACCSGGDRCNEIPEPRTSKGVLSCFGEGPNTLPCGFGQDQCWTYRDIKKDGGVVTRSGCFPGNQFGMRNKCALGNRTIQGGVIRETTACCSTPNCNTPTCTDQPTATTVV